MQNQLSQLIREIESQLGTRDMVELVLDALSETIKNYDVQDDKKFCDKFSEMIKDIKNTRPKIGLLIEDFYELWQVVDAEEHCNKHLDNACLKCTDLKRAILKKIKNLKKKTRKDKKAISKNALKNINNGDTILVHTNSHTVMDALKSAIRKKRFSCIVAEQEHDKTLAIIEQLQKAQIPFKVVPEYMLSHIENEVNKVFLGAVTFNSTGNFVSNAGTNAIVSEFSGKVPIYILMGTRKCSFWETKAAHHSYKEKQIKNHKHSELNYNRIKFSHDRVPSDIIDFLITEKGKMTVKEMIECYNNEFKKRKKWRTNFFG